VVGPVARRAGAGGGGDSSLLQMQVGALRQLHSQMLQKYSCGRWGDRSLAVSTPPGPKQQQLQ